MFLKGKHILKNNKKKWTLLLSLVLIFVISVSAVFAYMVSKSDDYDYTMESAAVTIQPFVSKDGNNIVTDISAKNVGDADAYVRVEIVPMYRKISNGTLFWQAPTKGTNFDISYNTNDWILRNDGYFYYKKPLPIGATTTDLINSITVFTEPPKGCTLRFDVLVSGVQSVPDGRPAEEAWGVNVDNGIIKN